MNLEKINFHVIRDFSELVSVSVKFVTQNFKHFFKCILLIAGPFLLLSSIFGAIYQLHTMNVMVETRVNGGGLLTIYSSAFRHLGWQYFAFVFMSIFSTIFLLTTVYAYLIAYDLHGSQNFEVTTVRKIVVENIGRTLKGFLVFFLILFGIGVVVAIIAGLLLAILKIVAGVILGLVVLVAIVLSPPFVWQFSTFYLVQMKDNASVSEALRKVREVMRGEFFATWLIVVATVLIIIILSMIFTAPQLVYQILMKVGSNTNEIGTSVPFLIISTSCTFLGTFVHSLFYIVFGFHYYSLAEKMSGAALMNRIDEIGNTPSTDVDQQY